LRSPANNKKLTNTEENITSLAVRRSRWRSHPAVVARGHQAVGRRVRYGDVRRRRLCCWTAVKTRQRRRSDDASKDWRTDGRSRRGSHCCRGGQPPRR